MPQHKQKGAVAKENHFKTHGERGEVGQQQAGVKARQHEINCQPQPL